MGINLIILGSASGVPTVRRNPPTVCLQAGAPAVADEATAALDYVLRETSLPDLRLVAWRFALRGMPCLLQSDYCASAA